MKETGLLFGPDMVRAILAGRKRVTRRSLDPKVEVHPNGFLTKRKGRDRLHPYVCPFGGPGDRIWVRENWAALDKNYAPVPFPDDLRFGPWPHVAYYADHHDAHGDGPSNPMRWRPSIHMPRWACRLVLRIVSVDLERLRDVTEEEAILKGARWVDFGQDQYGQQRPGWSMRDPFPESSDGCHSSARATFGAYVNECYAGPRWNVKPDGDLFDRNPWVWRIEFDPAGVAA